MELTRWALERPAVTVTTACFAQSRCHAPLAGSIVGQYQDDVRSVRCRNPGRLDNLVHVVRGWREQLEAGHPTDVP